MGIGTCFQALWREEGILVLVEIDQRVGTEVDRVGAGNEGAVEEIGIEDLQREGRQPPVEPP